MNAVSTHPSAQGGMFRQQGHSILIAFSSLLDAVQNKVLVAADDIDAEQRREIGRELGLMRWQLDQAFKDAGLEKFPGSMHLMREDEIARAYGDAP